MSFVVVETFQIFLFDYYYCKNAILWPRKVHFWTTTKKDVICDGSFHYSLQVFKPFDPIYQLNWRSMCCLSTHEIFWGAQGTLPRERNATTCTHGAQCESSCCSPCGVSRASKKRCRHRRGGKFLVLSVQGRSKDPTPSELYTNLQAKRSSKCFKAKKQSFVYISFLPF